jgi:hypothetical protein
MFVIVEQTKLVVEDLGTISQMEGRIRKTLDLRPPVTNGDDPDEWHTHHVTHVLEGPFKAVLEGTTRSHHDDVPVQIAARYHDDVSCPKHDMNFSRRCELSKTQHANHNPSKADECPRKSPPKEGVWTHCRVFGRPSGRIVVKAPVPGRAKAGERAMSV